jgi:glycosyltransferase involved in cell wall biosynthesis
MNLLSVITVNLNNAKGLLNTIASVAVQKNANLEHIVIDGASTDGSREIINKYKTCFAYSISEKDSGIYQAMNKGIKAAKGDYVLFLNSGDTFTSADVIAQLQQNIKNTHADIYHTDIVLIDERKNHAYMHHYPTSVDTKYFLNNTISHQTASIRKSLFDVLGYYNENYKIASDWEFFLKASKAGYSFTHLSSINISNFTLNGMSANYQLGLNEMQDVLTKQHPELISLAKKPLPSLSKRIWDKLHRDLPLHKLYILKNYRRKQYYKYYEQQISANIAQLNHDMELKATK